MRIELSALLFTGLWSLCLTACGDGPDDPKPDSDTPAEDLDEDGYTEAQGDCDDRDPAVNPGADELCNGIDDDCDGYTDLGAVDATEWHADGDGDGYGCFTCVTTSCEQPKGRVADNTDCDDEDASVHPGAEELCDGVDSDCDGQSDEDDPDAGCSEEPVEDCDNGADDDEDGLIDCEDGDCADDAACSEAGHCTDGLDNDDDGDTDCADGECWATCRALPHSARATDGRMELVHRRAWSHWDIVYASMGGVANGTFHTSANSARAYSVTGWLYVFPSTWASSPIAHCRWSVAQASLTYSGRGSDDGMADSYTLHPAQRSGFAIEEGCGWVTSGFLPASPAPWGRRVIVPSNWMHSTWGMRMDWYMGSLIDSARSTSSSSWQTRDPSTAAWWESIETSFRTRRYEVGINDVGDSYPFR
jgi:hypothetical protein